MKQTVTTGTTERNWVTLFKQYENIEELNRRVLMSLVDRILIYENHVIEIVFKYKDEYQQTLEYVLSYRNFTLFVLYIGLTHDPPLEYSNKAPFGHYSARWRSSVKPRTAKVSGSSSTP